jgi:hypothetical protein
MCLLPVVGLISACGLVETNVTTIQADIEVDGDQPANLAKPLQLATKLTHGETLVCEFTPSEPPFPLMEPLGRTSRDAVRLRQRCPNLPADMPFALLMTENSYYVGLKDCRPTVIYKVKGRTGEYLQVLPQGECATPDKFILQPCPGRQGDPSARCV